MFSKVMRSLFLDGENICLVRDEAVWMDEVLCHISNDVLFYYCLLMEWKSRRDWMSDRKIRDKVSWWREVVMWLYEIAWTCVYRCIIVGVDGVIPNQKIA